MSTCRRWLGTILLIQTVEPQWLQAVRKAQAILSVTLKRIHGFKMWIPSNRHFWSLMLWLERTPSKLSLCQSFSPKSVKGERKTRKAECCMGIGSWIGGRSSPESCRAQRRGSGRLHHLQPCYSLPSIFWFFTLSSCPATNLNTSICVHFNGM